jgi:DNA-damage-inducible protein J
MAQTAFVRARIDEKIRDDAAEVLAAMGLTVSDAVRMTLTQVAQNGTFPAGFKIPNAATKTAMLEARKLMQAKTHRFKTASEHFESLDKKSR